MMETKIITFENNYNYEYNAYNYLQGTILRRRIIEKTKDALFTTLVKKVKKQVEIDNKNVNIEIPVCTILVECPKIGKMELLAGADMAKTAYLIKDIVKNKIQLYEIADYIKEHCDNEAIEKLIDKAINNLQPKEIDEDIKIYER